MADLALLAPWLESGDVLVLLGPASEVGAAAGPSPRRPRPRRAGAVARGGPAPRTSWSSWSPTGCPRAGGASGVPAPRPTPPGWPGFARSAGLGAVLTNAVRYADRRDAPVVDVLDAARRLVALDRRHVDRVNAEGFLKSGKQMLEVAEEIARLAGLGDTEREARRLLAQTRQVADRCALDPRAVTGAPCNSIFRLSADD